MSQFWNFTMEAFNNHSLKVDFRTRNITRDKKRYYIMIKETLHQEDKRILNLYTPNN